MNKSELIDKLSVEANITKTKASEVIESVINSIIDAAKKDDKVTLTGFGSFVVSKRKEREGRNPQTGAKITIPASSVPRFTPGKAFKDAVK
ncbi:MAG: HU family DNA-binding protein [Nitrospirae bacterium]|nr:HU family DNA-binding protein [Nitrospirota bacterium]